MVANSSYEFDIQFGSIELVRPLGLTIFPVETPQPKTIFKSKHTQCIMFKINAFLFVLQNHKGFLLSHYKIVEVHAF